MELLKRFKAIMSSNIHALLEKTDDPEKMIDQYLQELGKELRKVKSESASVDMAEKRAKRALHDCKNDIDRMDQYAKKSLEEGKENAARQFIEKKFELKTKLEKLQATYELALKTATQMNQMHDKLISDIEALELRSRIIKGKATGVKTQKSIHESSSKRKGTPPADSLLDKLEEQIEYEFYEANALNELRKGGEMDITDNRTKYDKSIQVDDELIVLKQKLKENR